LTDPTIIRLPGRRNLEHALKADTVFELMYKQLFAVYVCVES